MVVMDHMDWFDSSNVSVLEPLFLVLDLTDAYVAQTGDCPLDAEIAQMHRVLSKGGAVYWRSAARKPWYIANFVKQGFEVEALGIRRPGEGPIDRVNMVGAPVV